MLQITWSTYTPWIIDLRIPYTTWILQETYKQITTLLTVRRLLTPHKMKKKGLDSSLLCQARTPILLGTCRTLVGYGSTGSSSQLYQCTCDKEQHDCFITLWVSFLFLSNWTVICCSITCWFIPLINNLLYLNKFLLEMVLFPKKCCTIEELPITWLFFFSLFVFHFADFRVYLDVPEFECNGYPIWNGWLWFPIHLGHWMAGFHENGHGYIKPTLKIVC